jgi:murein DD-endopeptidase MepM/ murein hydrolase activator NlpD
MPTPPRRRLRRILVSVTALEALLWAAYAFAGGVPGAPVDGVAVERIPASFHAPREGGRRLHQGVDILAPRGTPVRSVSAGVVVRVAQQPKGGKVVFVAGGGALLFFYAHLNDFAPGLHVGKPVAPGEILGTVGDSGNAKGVTHLHFEARPAATLFAPVDPLLVLHPWRHGPAARVRGALATVGEPR